MNNKKDKSYVYNYYEIENKKEEYKKIYDSIDTTKKDITNKKYYNFQIILLICYIIFTYIGTVFNFFGEILIAFNIIAFIAVTIYTCWNISENKLFIIPFCLSLIHHIYLIIALISAILNY